MQFAELLLNDNERCTLDIIRKYKIILYGSVRDELRYFFFFISHLYPRADLLVLFSTCLPVDPAFTIYHNFL